MKKLFYFLFLSVLTACGQSPFHWQDNVLYDGNGDKVLTLAAESPEGVTSDFQVKEDGEGLFRVTWKFTAGKDIEDAFIHLDVTMPQKAEWWMMPSVSYNGNEWGTGLEPKGARDGDGGWWTYSFRRSPIPGAVYSEGPDYAVATWSTVPQKEDDNFSYSIMPEDGQVTHRIIWPEEEMPRTYSSRDVLSEGWRHVSSLKAGECRTFEMMVDVTVREQDHRSIAHFLKAAWTMAEKIDFEIPSDEELWKNGIRFLKESLWNSDNGFLGFNIGLTPANGMMNDYCDPEQDGNDEWKKTHRFQSGWCGQNISLDCSLLTDYLKTGDESSLSMGLSSLDCWAEKAILPNGLFPSDFFGKTYDSCHMGNVSMMFREAYHLAKECGCERDLYRKVSLDICNVVMDTQREDGCYGRNWNEDGTCVSYDGFTACFMLEAMFEAYRETGDERYMNSAKKAFDYYMGEFDRLGYTTAGALDTNCIDKESSVPLLFTALDMYEVLKEKRYLDDAVALGYYISTWLWHYDGIYPKNDSFSEYGYHTFGGTSISTQHTALDNYGLLPVLGMHRLAEFTGDRQWKEKADAMWNYGCQLISDGSLVVNGRKRPAGGQNEAYFQNTWRIYGTVGRFDNWLVAWPNAFRLEVLRKEGR